MELEIHGKTRPDINGNSDKENVIGPWKSVWLRLERNKLALAGLLIICFLALASIFGPVISPYKMETIDLLHKNTKPSIEHILGTDSIGRDVLTRLMYAGRVSLTVGLVSVVISVIIGTLLGAIAGFYGGLVDGLIMRLVDVFLCFPFLPLLIMLGAVMAELNFAPEYRIYVIILIIGLTSWPSLCRLVRGEILSLRECEFIEATVALGIKDWKKIIKHLIPNTFASIIVTATLGVGSAILGESGLSFLGLGITPPTPSWGEMILAANNMYTFQFRIWQWIPPGFCILITVMAINLFGDGLRDALDPKHNK